MLAEQLCEACGFKLMPTLKLDFMLFCQWLAIQKRLVCDLVRGNFVVLFCHYRIAGQLLDHGPCFLLLCVMLVFLMWSSQVLDHS